MAALLRSAVEKLAPVALVFSDRCPGAFVRVCRGPWPEILTYQAAPRGTLTDLHGPPVDTVVQIPALAVVWVGIPTEWVEAQLDCVPALFASHFVGAARQFARVKNSVAVQTAVRAALEGQKEAVEQQQEAVEQQQAAVEAEVVVQVERKRRKIGEEAPWYVPEELA